MTNPIRSPRLALAAMAVLLAVPACSAPEADAAPQQSVERRAIQPSARSPYSAGHQVGNTYYFSGKLGVSQETRAMTEGRIEAETTNIMEAFRELFESEGLTFADVVQGNVYLADLDDFGAMNATYATYFPEDPPARVTVGSALVAGAAIEISFIAVKR